MTDLAIAMTEQQHKSMLLHLFPGDGLEASAILVCGRSGIGEERLSVRNVIPVPYQECSTRTRNKISWPGQWLERAIDIAESGSFSIVLVHSHPGGLYGFSKVDDESDALIISSLFSALPKGPHGSAVMTPDGHLCVRLFLSATSDPHPCKATRVGTDIYELSPQGWQYVLPFTKSMTERLASLSVCVVGVSGTGGIVAELISRMGVGRLILIDFDHVEHKNLNRIPHSTLVHADEKTAKVQMMADAIKCYRADIEIIQVKEAIGVPSAIKAASGADVIFSCVDSIEGRLYCDLIGQASIIPLIDLGVTIPTRQGEDGSRKIGDICGRVDYVCPDGPSLQDRGVVTPEGLYRENLLRCDPEDAARQLKEGYIKGVIEEAPSVIHLNMRAAQEAVNEWLCRLFPLRHEDNSNYARILFSLAAMETDFYQEEDFQVGQKLLLGQGLAEPLLGMSLYEAQPEEAA